MKHRSLGVLLILTLIAAGVALGQNLRFDHALEAARADAGAIEARLAGLDRDVMELGAAHAGYVATGQDAGQWMLRTAVLSERLETELGALAAAAGNDDTELRAHYQAAATALAEFNGLDDRTRRYVADNQLFLASDLIFMDGLEAGRRISEAIRRAAGAERQAAGARMARIAWMRFAMNGVAMAFVVGVAFLAVRVGTRQADAAADAEAAPDEAAPTPAPATPAARMARDPDLDGGPAVIIREVGVSRAGLDDTAELCADMARLMDSRDLPAIVERTARILEAKGVVLWTADSGNGVLQPALTHGYSERVVRRLGSLKTDGDNVTALAYRSLRPQMVSGITDEAPGAVAVPLVTTAGCVGVLSAETRARRPKAETLALARIVAAQFSTVVQPAADPPAEARQSL